MPHLPSGEMRHLLYQCCKGLFSVGAGGYESLACLVVLELLEVVDEHVGELVGFGVPFLGIGVSVAGIQDFGVYTGELGGNGEVEDGDNLGGGLRIAPSRIASMIPRVSRIEIRLPEPFQPVFTR